MVSPWLEFVYIRYRSAAHVLSSTYIILYYIIMHDLGITVNLYFLIQNLIPKLLTHSRTFILGGNFLSNILSERSINDTENLIFI